MDAEAELLFHELTGNKRETQVAYQDGLRHVARLRSAETNTALKVPAGEPYRLEIKAKGQLDQVALNSTVRMRPGPGQVEINEVPQANSPLTAGFGPRHTFSYSNSVIGLNPDQSI